MLNGFRNLYNPYAPYMDPKYRYDVKQQPDINSTLGAVDKEDANLEAERGELVVKPDMSGIYKVAGKPHSKGGTPLNLDDGSFVFSDDKKLHFNKHEKKLFEFKEGGSVSMRLNTPAKILNREIDLKHYNHTSNILNDKSGIGYDLIAKNSAQLMLSKYQEKAGQVAFLQEAKKGFPNGVPAFSMNTAPLYAATTKEKITQNPQYMKSGGYTNPYMQAGGIKKKPYNPLVPFDPWVPDDEPDYTKPTRDTPGAIYPSRNGERTPTGRSPQYNYGEGVPQQYEDWTKAGVDFTGLKPEEVQSKMYDWALNNNPELIRSMWKRYGMTNKGRSLGLDTNDMSLPGLAAMKAGYTDNLMGARTLHPNGFTMPPQSPYAPKAPMVNGRPLNPSIVQGVTPNQYDINVKAPQGMTPGLDPNTFQKSTTLPYIPRVPLSPLQKANIAYSAYQALNIKRYAPMRENMTSPLVELEKYNPQQALNVVDNSANRAYQANQLSNPYLGASANAGIFGKTLEAKQQVLDSFADRNVGIANQQNLTNNGIQRQDLQFNTQANGNYYNQVQALNQNYDNERRFAGNQTVSLTNDYLSKNQELEQWLGSQRTAGKVQIGVDKQGNPIYQRAPLFDVDTRGFSPRVYYTGAGDLNSLPYQSNRANDTQLLIQTLKSNGIEPNSAAGARIIAGVLSKGPFQQQYNANPGYKRGGVVKRNPYK